MAKPGGPSTSSAPTLDELQRSLEEISTSIGDFVRAHSQWFLYHQASLPIIGQAWTDCQSDLSTHVGSIPGLRSLRLAVSKELQWVERHAADVGLQSVFTSSNAFYLTTSWQHVLYSALHESPIVELDAYMSLGQSGHSKSAKVDIVCQGGKRWIRLSTVKPLSLLSEFRSAESYVVGDESSSEEGEENEHEPALSLELIKSQLAKGEVDGIASQCSIMKMARELAMAADVAEQKSQRARPQVHVALTRLSLQDLSSSLQGKFYNDEEQDRFEARVHAMVVEMERMGLVVLLKDQRQLCEREEEAIFLPASIASGQAAQSNRVTPLPKLPLPPAVHTSSATATINLDLSALVAFVSQISHLPIDHLGSVDDADQCFRKDHHASDDLGPPIEDATLQEKRGAGEKTAQGQHARALSDQLRREMTGDGFFEAVLRHLPDNQQLRLICTAEAEEKFHEILNLVGGPTEQKRAKSLFVNDGQDSFWAGSRWEHNGSIRHRITLPVNAVSFCASSIPPLPLSTCGDEQHDCFDRLARKSVEEGLQNLQDPATSSVGTGVQRQTTHTLASMMYGLVQQCTTLTTNIASVKWLVRDVCRIQAAEANTKGHVQVHHPTPFPSAVLLFYPRSLAEKMMTSTCLLSLNASSTPAWRPAGECRSETDAEAAKCSPTESIQDKTASTGASIGGARGGGVGDRRLAATGILGFASHDSKLPRAYRATATWVRGPRPRSTLLIRYFKWWPLRPVEEWWLRWTSLLAWKDPRHTHRQHCQLNSSTSSSDVEGQRLESSSSTGGDKVATARADWKLNRLHWIALALTYIAWAFGFTFLVRGLWYEASVTSEGGGAVAPSFFGCTTTYWLANSACGLNGVSCSPFSSPTSVPFRCPASCETTTLGGPRAVGDQLPSYVPLVVGGGPAESSDGAFIYRGDSFICSAAIHAGVLSSEKGGCGSLRLNGAYSNYEGVDRNGIRSTPFNSSFPVSFSFESSAEGSLCTDRSSRGYILNVILLAWLGFVLQPKRIVYFFSLVVVGFWHINFVSEPREYPMSVGDPMGDFLPTLFVAYGLWRLTFRFVWPAFERLPLERNVWIQSFFWIGVLLNLVFANVPLNRLVANDIASQPGALTALIVIVVIVLVIAVNQIRVIRKVGKLAKYLTLTIVAAIIIGLLAAIPTTGLRLHHYIIAMALLPYCAFPTRLSLIYSSFLLGMFLNGVGRWGYDGIIQDVAVIRGAAVIGTGLPSFLPASNWTGVQGFSSAANDTTTSGFVHWQDIPSNQTDEWDSFQLLIDDVLRLQSSQTTFNISQLSQYYLDSNTDSLSSALLPSSNLSLYPGGSTVANVQDSIASQPHYLRLAYFNSNSASLGDFTEAAILWFNGTFVSPGPGAT